ncbi:phosphatase PAP2 family protein [Defluviimonas sp. SAOS-178_SWC]|uniref:phosphatase PAP2 family protein n=1 Tax=Defluviimonas sp. SAOS-178_SWC TaxID=3121287 RepID=UPI003221D866
MPGLDLRKTAFWYAIAFAVSLTLFVLWPGLDIAVSSWFYRPGAGFWLAENTWVEGIRYLIWDMSILAFVLSAAAFIYALVRRRARGEGGKIAGYIFLLYLLGPILLVDGILKRFWGRARPATITEFGGDKMFAPPWLPSDQCASNCSFVSGEGSAAAALALCFLVLAPIARRVLPRAAFGVYAAAGVVFPAAGLALRVMTGRHFLSDTIFAVLFVTGIALVLHRLLLAERRG